MSSYISSFAPIIRLQLKVKGALYGQNLIYTFSSLDTRTNFSKNLKKFITFSQSEAIFNIHCTFFDNEICLLININKNENYLRVQISSIRNSEL